MTAELPAGLTVRPARPDDDAAIAAQLAAYTSALIGFPKHSAEDVANYLRDPKLRLATDSWLVHDGDRLVGTATALAHNVPGQVDVDVFSADPAVAAWLLDRACAHAVDRARGADLAEVKLRVGVLREDTALPELLAGFTLETSIQRMRIDHPEPPPVPEPPAGVVLRRGAFDDATRRAAHAVIAGAFADQPGAVPRPYDDWLASREARSTFDWSQLTVAELDGRAVAVQECNDNLVRSDRCGYIGRLGVLPGARGRGLAKYLLLDQFAQDAAAGLTGTMLHVDSSNPTPAVALYRGVGMRPNAVSDLWSKVVPLG
ncbi:GCN5-related N-acetyltransferase [Kribbella flavida DSM 17836]|uniref:GCN5-related N-acetyltransferase n=1 Tax=Kribbella flavida (strain DSM 17836 / JCM 10339 / NBRC 14399) TaxID=479435 RepID=D2Q2Y5_KRIFD|nr:GNAT family N-acetyltransferase [Kribbella flavida]ADB32110.1 GCN5-related N-acetyltransferase [Kribbella flavida DSM 17836]